MTPQEKIIFDRVNMLAARIFNDPSHVLVSQFRRVMTEHFMETYQADVPFASATVASATPEEPTPQPQPVGSSPRPHLGPRIGRPKMGPDPDLPR